jgi:glycosyltransferase involved in cell wall biosynthesis
VLYQDLLPAEVIVVGHGDRVLPADVCRDPRVRAFDVGACPTGKARAAGLAAVTTSFVAYCDDLDTWTSDHLRALLEAIEAEPETALVSAVMDWVNEAGRMVEAPAAVPWPEGKQAPFIFASGLLHRVEAARRVGGWDHYLNAFGEWDLVLRLSDWWGIQNVDATLGTREVHPDRDDLGPTAINDRDRVLKHALTRRIRFPRHRSARSSRTRPQSFDPASWRDGRRELDVQAIFQGQHSYASVVQGLLPALERQGISLFLGPQTQPIPPMFSHCGRADDGTRRMVFLYHTAMRPRMIGTEPLVQYTMYEQDLLPKIHVEEINRYVSLLLVPCRMNLETFVGASVEAPAKVLHHGVDPLAFPLLDRPPRDVFTFGTFGQQNERKGVDVLLRAFRDEFAPHEPVRLILNATMTDRWIQEQTPNVEVRSAFLDHAGLLAYLRELDAFVLPSRGEGFGLCGLEAMATGLPLIATNWSGPADYLDPADSYPLSYELVETGGRDFSTMRLFGRWAEPSYEHLRALLRRLCERPDEARAMGLRASVRVHAEWTWDRVARQLAADLDLLAHGVSPISV